MKLDILVLAVHPDDAELGCAGTILKHVALGHKVGILDFTKGDLGTRGTPELRIEEATNAAKTLGLAYRANLGFRDGFFKNDEEHQLAIIQKIRLLKPEIVICNAIKDRHPDHGRSHNLAVEACFYSGLRKIETFEENGSSQEAWRPKQVFHYIQDQYIEPDFIIDISEHWTQKMEAIMAFGSQFYDPRSAEPSSYISSMDFMAFVEGRAKEMGHKIGVSYGEGFTSHRKIGVRNLFDVQ